MKKHIEMPRQKSLAVPEVSNPFVHELKLSFMDKLQVALMSVTVVPVRLILLVLLFLMAWPLAAVGVAFRCRADQTKPLSGWRKSIHKPFVALGRAAYYVLGFCRIRTKGKRVPAHVAPMLVVAPHSSMFDTLLFFLQAPLSSPVSRSENATIPLIGSLIKLSQPVLVKREDPDSRSKAVKEIQRRGQSGGQWPQVIIFPEGTCTNRTCLISFKLGAFYPGVPVQPVCVRYPNKLDTVTWTWQGPKALTQLWLTMCQFYTRCEVEYLPVYIPNEAEKADPRLFADNVRAVMAECLKLPTTDHSFDDCRLMLAAEKLKMPAGVGLVEFEKLHSKLGVKFDEMQNLLQKFSEIKRDRFKKEKVSSITFKEFTDYLMLPDSEALQQVFDLYDRDGSGTIDFREYVIGLSLVSSPVNNDDTIQLAFELFDTDNSGYITQEKLQVLLVAAFNITEEDSSKIFHEINTSKDGRITIDEFKSYAKRKPEYAKIFTTYRELKIEAEKYASEDELSTDFEQWGSQVDDSTKSVKKQQ